MSLMICADIDQLIASFLTVEFDPNNKIIHIRSIKSISCTNHAFNQILYDKRTQWLRFYSLIMSDESRSLFGSNKANLGTGIIHFDTNYNLGELYYYDPIIQSALPFPWIAKEVIMDKYISSTTYCQRVLTIVLEHSTDNQIIDIMAEKVNHWAASSVLSNILIPKEIGGGAMFKGHLINRIINKHNGLNDIIASNIIYMLNSSNKLFMRETVDIIPLLREAFEYNHMSLVQSIINNYDFVIKSDRIYYESKSSPPLDVIKQLGSKKKYKLFLEYFLHRKNSSNVRINLDHIIYADIRSHNLIVDILQWQAELDNYCTIYVLAHLIRTTIENGIRKEKLEAFDKYLFAYVTNCSCDDLTTYIRILAIYLSNKELDANKNN